VSARLAGLVRQLPAVTALVVGEAMLDSYLDGSTTRVCREAPVPIVALADRRDAPGGAANTARNLRALGSRTRLLSVIGDDADGDRLRRVVEAAGIPSGDLILERGRRTLAKQRVLADGHMLLRMDDGSTGPIGPAAEAALFERLRAAHREADVVVISDYGYGVLTPRVRDVLADLQDARPRILVVDAKALPAYRHARPTAVKPNHDEAMRLLGHDGGPRAGGRADAVIAHADALLERTGARIVAVTLDTDGAVLVERGRPASRTLAGPPRPGRAAGAGDTFAAALALALAAGAETPAAADLASAAAAVVVGKEGTAACSAAELMQHLTAEDKYVSDRGRLVERIDFSRQQGRRIVFTNGCFDLLHRGHVGYLSRAKALGDVLVVGLNTDEGVRRLKGSGRPINPIEDRAEVLAALSCVDHITPFGEETPCELIQVVRPDVFVKGGDYTRDRLPEARLVEELGGAIHLLPYLEDHSTTGLIDRIRAAGARAA
jgi:D-beta-D-heptose 7-phosphate kinase/D-beta-D-heptose 1-phosphate adenosyltransferase